MADVIPKSTQGLVDFIQQNGDAVVAYLIGPKTLSDLADFLDEQRKKAIDFMPSNSTIAFDASADHDTLAAQKTLLDKIASTEKLLQQERNDPSSFGLLLGLRSNYFAALATTYNSVFTYAITFSQDELDRFNALISRATLDTAQRQMEANVLDATVQLTKFAMSVLASLL